MPHRGGGGAAPGVAVLRCQGVWTGGFGCMYASVRRCLWAWQPGGRGGQLRLYLCVNAEVPGDRGGWGMGADMVGSGAALRLHMHQCSGALGARGLRMCFIPEAFGGVQGGGRGGAEGRGAVTLGHLDKGATLFVAPRAPPAASPSELGLVGGPSSKKTHQRRRQSTVVGSPSLHPCTPSRTSVPPKALDITVRQSTCPPPPRPWQHATCLTQGRAGTARSCLCQLHGTLLFYRGR